MSWGGRNSWPRARLYLIPWPGPVRSRSRAVMTNEQWGLWWKAASHTIYTLGKICCALRCAWWWKKRTQRRGPKPRNWIESLVIFIRG